MPSGTLRGRRRSRRPPQSAAHRSGTRVPSAQWSSRWTSCSSTSRSSRSTRRRGERLEKTDRESRDPRRRHRTRRGVRWNDEDLEYAARLREARYQAAEGHARDLHRGRRSPPGLPLFDSMYLLGRDRTLRRLRAAASASSGVSAREGWKIVRRVGLVVLLAAAARIRRHRSYRCGGPLVTTTPGARRPSSCSVPRSTTARRRRCSRPSSTTPRALQARHRSADRRDRRQADRRRVHRSHVPADYLHEHRHPRRRDPARDHESQRPGSRSRPPPAVPRESRHEGVVLVSGSVPLAHPTIADEVGSMP